MQTDWKIKMRAAQGVGGRGTVKPGGWLAGWRCYFLMYGRMRMLLVVPGPGREPHTKTTAWCGFRRSCSSPKRIAYCSRLWMSCSHCDAFGSDRRPHTHDIRRRRRRRRRLRAQAEASMPASFNHFTI